MVVRLAGERQRGPDVEGPHVTGDVGGGQDVRQPAAQGRLDALVVENRGGMGEREHGAGLPEVAAGHRGAPHPIGCPLPVEDEIHPAPIRTLHGEHEVEQPIAPPSHPRQPGGLPECAVQIEGAGGIVDAGDSFVAGLTGSHRLIQAVGVDGERQGPVAGKRERCVPVGPAASARRHLVEDRLDLEVRGREAAIGSPVVHADPLSPRVEGNESAGEDSVVEDADALVWPSGCEDRLR